MKKVKFRLKNANWLRLAILIFSAAFFAGGAYMFMKNEYIFAAVGAVCGLTVFGGIIATYRHGIKIKNGKYKFRCAIKRRKFKEETIREIKLYFVKSKKRYGVYAEVYTKDSLKPFEFYWLNVRTKIKDKTSKTKITDKNIYDVISNLNKDPLFKARYIV